MAGFEPANDGVKVRCLTAWLHPYKKVVKKGIDIDSLSFSGVGNGARTHDTRNHNPVLCQLSYTHHIKFGTPREIRTPDLLLRRQLLYPAELLAHVSLSYCSMERVMGIEPTYPAWKAGVLPLNYTRIWATDSQLRNNSTNSLTCQHLFYAFFQKLFHSPVFILISALPPCTIPRFPIQYMAHLSTRKEDGQYVPPRNT